MVFSGLSFIFFYLPLVLLCCLILPAKGRNGFLFFANLIFYGWGEPIFLFIMLASIVINYFFGLLISKYSAKAKALLIIGIVADLSLIFFFKYADFCREAISALTGVSFGAPLGLALPIGISFYTFQAVSYLLDIYRGTVKAERNIVVFGTYLSFFPQLIAGPIVRYDEMSHALHHPGVTMAQFTAGCRLFIIGLGKKVCIANEMGLLWQHLQPLAAAEGIFCAWIGIVAFALQIYFDFSGYSDMARGLGKMFGFELPINFNYPYNAKSLQDFWRRWHMTLTRWFKDYLYIPLGGSRRGIIRTVFNLFVVWSLTGLWHGANYNFLLWGIYWFAFLVGEKFIWGRFLNKLPKLVSYLYTTIFVLISWVFFSITDLGNVIAYLQAMFSLKNGFLSGDSLVYVLSYAPLLIVAFIASQPWGKRLWEKLSQLKSISALEICCLGILFLLSLAALVNQSYNPFLYFRF
ncbi:MAG: MBOAT family O-acyltransferase [Bacillota bacterium]|nr:MBOAT family O-acyltransferase [Bacillota bacterium]